MNFYMQTKNGPRAKWRNVGMPRTREAAIALARDIEEHGDVARAADAKGNVVAEMLKGVWIEYPVQP